MNEPRQSGAANTAAALARLESEVKTLQRERREDRQRWSDDLRRFEAMLERVAPSIKEQVGEAIRPLAAEIAQVRTDSEANAKWITQVKAQGAVMAVSLAGVGAFLMWAGNHLIGWLGNAR